MSNLTYPTFCLFCHLESTFIWASMYLDSWRWNKEFRWLARCFWVVRYFLPKEQPLFLVPVCSWAGSGREHTWNMYLFRPCAGVLVDKAKEMNYLYLLQMSMFAIATKVQRPSYMVPCHWCLYSSAEACHINMGELRNISDKTACMVGLQGENNEYKHYDVHNLYGWSQTEPTLV